MWPLMNITYINEVSVEDYNILRDSVGWGACNCEKVRMALDRSDFIIAAQINGQTVGMARVMQDGLQAIVMDVMVLPDYQKHGIGKTMMRHIMEYLKSTSHEGGVFVNLMSAKGREEFYEQFGFIKRPTDDRGCGMTQWVEIKETGK